MPTELADIHVLLEPSLKERLRKHYPIHGQLSELVRNILNLIDLQLENTDRVDVLQIARAVIEDERRRGARGVGKSSRKKTM